MNQFSLYLFNPDHDLALANGSPNYTAPASARRLMADLALLPMWYAQQGSGVLASSAYNVPFFEEMRAYFPELPRLLTEPEVGLEPLCVSIPWGWNPAVCKRLLSLGISPEALPDRLQLEAIRERSHRSTAVDVLRALRLDEDFCGESFYLTASEDICRFVEGREVCLLKAPLSGSGKGLNWCRGVYSPPVSRWCEHVLSRQGGVVAEPVYDKAVDFAMLFCADSKGGITFSGYSLFSTSASGAYEGNLLLSDELIEQRLSGYVSLSSLRALRFVLEKELSERLGGCYTGYLGVDMMICRFADVPEFRIHPCVEINLRMTMGAVARLFYDSYVRPGAKGTFRVDYFPTPGQLAAEHLRLSAAHPLQMSGGRIVGGYLSLTPVTPISQYAAWVLLDEF